MGCEHYGDYYTSIGPAELQAERERLLAWLPTRQAELELSDAELGRFADLLRDSMPPTPATQEPSVALRRLLEQRNRVETFLVSSPK